MNLRSISCRVILLIGFALLIGLLTPARAFIGVSVNAGIAPPPLPVYVQPAIPAPGYIWTPGYWAWDPDSQDYYWVPGTWVFAPRVGYLWTPPWWGWGNGVYVFHTGYWGPHIGFYGGIAYGCGYTGYGYEGGYWNGGHFFYNRAVNNVTNVDITNVYSKAVIANRSTSISYNGGAGGLLARPTAEQLQAAHESHLAATALQTQHFKAALKDPRFHYSTNHGNPAIAATARPGAFKKLAGAPKARLDQHPGPLKEHKSKAVVAAHTAVSHPKGHPLVESHHPVHAARVHRPAPHVVRQKTHPKPKPKKDQR